MTKEDGRVIVDLVPSRVNDLRAMYCIDSCVVLQAPGTPIAPPEVGDMSVRTLERANGDLVPINDSCDAFLCTGTQCGVKTNRF